MTREGVAGPVGDWQGRHRAGMVGRLRRALAARGSEVTAPYTDWMSILLRSSPDHAHLPAGLNVEDAVRIAEAVTAAHAESTRTVYDWAWSQWERWCHARGATALPAEPALICAYLTERAAAGASPSAPSTSPTTPSPIATACTACPIRSSPRACARSAEGCDE